MKPGIQTRLLLITTLVLGSFLTLSGLVLEQSFRSSILFGAEEQLRLVVYSIMGAVQIEDGELEVPEPLPEPRLGRPQSGLYAWVTAADGALLWRSISAAASGLAQAPADAALRPGELRFAAESAAGAGLFHLSYAVIWEEAEESELTFHVAADPAPYRASIRGFRQSLLFGLTAVTLLFVLVQYLAVHWGLRPLRTMAEEVRAMEEGRRERLSDAYPAELEGLAANLTRFIAHEQRSRSRYRKAMDDLAHSLKTPLAVIRNELASVPAQSQGLVREQLERMQTAVNHQLSRAQMAGPVVVSRELVVLNPVERLVRALEIAYRDKGIAVELAVPEALRVRADERDLMEMLGNLLENAFKYTRSRVLVSGVRDGRLKILVEDDGPGIAPETRRAVLDRGTRADEMASGQGIGLAVVSELAGLYQGTLTIGDSRFGGAMVCLELP